MNIFVCDFICDDVTNSCFVNYGVKNFVVYLFFTSEHIFQCSTGNDIFFLEEWGYEDVKRSWGERVRKREREN